MDTALTTPIIRDRRKIVNPIINRFDKRILGENRRLTVFMGVLHFGWFVPAGVLRVARRA